MSEVSPKRFWIKDSKEEPAIVENHSGSRRRVEGAEGYLQERDQETPILAPENAQKENRGIPTFN